MRWLEDKKKTHFSMNCITKEFSGKDEIQNRFSGNVVVQADAALSVFIVWRELRCPCLFIKWLNDERGCDKDGGCADVRDKHAERAGQLWKRG